MRKKSEWTPRKLKELAVLVDDHKPSPDELDLLETAYPGIKEKLAQGVVAPETIQKALVWSAREIDALRKKLSWLFVMRNRKKPEAVTGG